MPYCFVNDCNLFYEISGSGPNLVFLHGESHGIELFDNQLPAFQDYRCLVYYRRGHGLSDLPRYGYSMWNQTQDLAQLLDALEMKEVVILAVAMSTPIAVTYALTYPERVRGLILAAWYELDGYPLLEKRRGKYKTTFAELHMQMEKIIEAHGREGLKDYIEKNAHDILPIFPSDPALRSKAAAMFSNHPSGHYIRSADYYTSIPNLVPDLGRIACSILGLCGQDDPIPDRPELVAHLPQFTQKWIKDARRFVMWEQPQRFNTSLREFLATL
jgi:3-oxoadipate enol-lactonase